MHFTVFEQLVVTLKGSFVQMEVANVLCAVRLWGLTSKALVVPLYITVCLTLRHWVTVNMTYGHSFIVNVKILEGVPNPPPWQTCKVFHAWVRSFTRLRYYTYASTCSLACFRCFSTFCLACTLSATVCRMSSAFWVQPWAFACSRAFTGGKGGGVINVNVE